MSGRIISFLFITLCSCISNQLENQDRKSKSLYLPENNPVKIEVIKKQAFTKELVSNGSLHAKQKSELTFETAEKIGYLPVKNGERVQAGQIIASLNKEKLKQTYRQAQLTYANAAIELEDVLIGRGYSISDSSIIPNDIFEAAKLRSGYARAKNDLETAEYNLNAAELRAPFTGIIANLEHKPYEQVSPGKPFCTLIDDSRFEVAFAVLETELNMVQLKQEVSIQPFSGNQRYAGTITEINPVVNENGLVKVKAELTNGAGKNLMDGMNVRVYIEHKVPNQLIVPRSAVVLRQNQEVLFKYTSGTAYWTYVNILNENSHSYSVIANPDKAASLEPGDTVIVEGNLNLAHETDVEIQQ